MQYTAAVRVDAACVVMSPERKCGLVRGCGHSFRGQSSVQLVLVCTTECVKYCCDVLDGLSAAAAAVSALQVSSLTCQLHRMISFRRHNGSLCIQHMRVMRTFVIVAILFALKALRMSSCVQAISSKCCCNRRGGPAHKLTS